MTTTSEAPKRQRRMAREPKAQTSADQKTQAQPTQRDRKPSKLDQVEAMLLREGDTSIAEMMEATGWQQHSVRGAMAGALKKRGLVIASEKVDGLRRYRASKSA